MANNKKNKLTPKQERFALNLFKGLSQRQAYIQAGYSKNGADNTLDQHAYELASSSEVLARLQELTEEASHKAVMPLHRRFRRLAELADMPVEKEVSAREVVMAIAETNRMTHIYDEKPQYQDNRVYNILVQGDEVRDRVNKLLEGKRPQEIGDEDASKS